MLTLCFTKGHHQDFRFLFLLKKKRNQKKKYIGKCLLLESREFSLKIELSQKQTFKIMIKKLFIWYQHVTASLMPVSNASLKQTAITATVF